MSICSFHCFALWLSSSPNRQPTKYIEQVLFKSKKNGRYKEKSDKFFVFDSEKHKKGNIFFLKKEQK